MNSILRLKDVVILLFVVFCVAGCFTSRPEDIEFFLKPAQVSVTADKYIIQPPDEIEIRCSMVPEINLQQQQIRPDGKVSFEGLGEIEVAGKTPTEAANAIKQKAEQLYKELSGDNPIDVRIAVYRSKAYYVLGQVDRPGPKVFTGRDTLLFALAEAHLNPLAWKDRIQVIRPSAQEDIRPRIFEVNFDRLVVHGDTSMNVLLQDGDIVYVPPTILAAAAMKVEEIIRPIARAFSGYYITQGSFGGGGGGGF